MLREFQASSLIILRFLKKKKKKKKIFGFFFCKSSNQLVKFFRVIFHLWSLPFKFRFYAFKVFLLVVSMLSALFFLLRCCR